MSMSDDDIWGAPQTASAPPQAAPATLSDDDIWGKPETAQPAGLWDRVANDFAGRVAPIVSDVAAGKESPMGGEFDIATKGVAGTAKDVASDAISSLPGSKALALAGKYFNNTIGKNISNSNLGTAAKEAETEAGEEWDKIDPVLRRHIEGIGDVAAVAPMVDGAGSAMRSVGNIAQDAYDADRAVRSPKMPPSKVLNAQADAEQNYKFVNGINDTVNQMKGVKTEEAPVTQGGYGEIYDKAKDIGNGVVVQAPSAKGNVDVLLADMKGDMAHKTEGGSSQAYKDMEAVSSSFDENGNIPLDKVTLLKRRLNDLYSPDMGDARSEIYGRLNDQVNKIIQQARAENPEWAQLMDSGNNLFLNYKKTTDSLDRAWSVSDKKEYEDALAARQRDPYSAPPPASVRQKIDNIAKPQNIQQYEDTMRVMPKELQEDYTNAVLENNPDNGRLTRGIKALFKASIGNKFGAANEAYNAAIGNAAERIDPEIAKQFPHAIDATNYHLSNARDVHQGWLDDQAQAAALRNQPKLLPAPDGSGMPPGSNIAHFYTDKGGYTQPGTPGIVRAALNNRPADLADAHALDMANRTSEIDRIYGGESAGMGRFAAQHPNLPMNDAGYIDINKVHPEYSAAQANKILNDAAWNKLTSEQQLNKLNDIEKAWAGHESDLKQAVMDSRARAQQVAEAKGEKYEDTAMGSALFDAIQRHGYARGGAINTNPTDHQKIAGNYKKGHKRVHGLEITIENPKGSERAGKTPDGRAWRAILGADYGYIRRTTGADGDHLDCYVGTGKSKRIYVMDQLRPEDKGFDEHKCFINFPDKDSALAAYRASFTDKNVNKRIGHVRRFSVQEFKQWLQSGGTNNPVRKAA